MQEILQHSDSLAVVPRHQQICIHISIYIAEGDACKARHT
jgi:hypothetical protein